MVMSPAWVEKECDARTSSEQELIEDPSDPKLITIDGTMQLCEELGIDPSSVSS